MKNWFMFWLIKLSHPVRGIRDGFLHDFSIRYEIIAGTIALLIINYLFGPFSALEQLLFIFCFFFMLITEFQNSIIETILDKLHPEQNKTIGYCKDLAAGASLLAGIFSLICLYYILSGKL